MTVREAEYQLTLHRRIAEIAETQWDACAGADNPFLTHAFLDALEESGAAAAETGWLPQHAALRDGAGRLLGVAPMYAKTHSYGEYVFDHGWADAYERAGGRYYPKLQIAVPFTPVPGRRLLLREETDEAARSALMAGLVQAAERLGVSSLHLTFCTEEEWRRLGAAGFLQRTGEQFHFENRGYATFEDFLADLASRKRKQVRRERREVTEAGIVIEVREGRELTEAHWDAMFAFYMDTGSRKWGRPYLNRRFFSLLHERMPEHCVLILARRAGRIIAGALNLRGTDTLYGRYWGCIEHHPCLHFELCYYQAIEYALARGLTRVEAGAQGEHKLARGYLPTPTYSAHWIADPRLREAIERYLVREREHVAEEIGYYASHAPFRRETD
ncbi:MAG: N-acetyltransferase [Alphaproteobacteria bacterium]|nr:N-acetyltransferase [Alphaproteobacteria bacterium]